VGVGAKQAWGGRKKGLANFMEQEENQQKSP
jgi:hypothetical protein